MQRIMGAIAIMIVFLISGCVASLNREYYLAAHDPQTEVTNYFRIKMQGQTWFSKSKFSIGFYDRDAVDRLFAENMMQGEYLATSIDLFDKKTGERLGNIAEQLSKAKEGEKESRKRRIRDALSSVTHLFGVYRERFEQDPVLQEQFKPGIQRAETALREAENALEQAVDQQDNVVNESKLEKARRKAVEAQAIMEAIRVAVDGKVLVRFFDGAGNEVNVVNKSMVIFVASDASRFTEAIRELADEKEATANILLTVLGPRIQEAQALKNRIKRSDSDENALSARTAEIKSRLPEGYEQDTNAEALEGAILETASAASSIAGGVRIFENSEQIKGYVEGMGANQ